MFLKTFTDKKKSHLWRKRLKSMMNLKFLSQAEVQNQLCEKRNFLKRNGEEGKTQN